jgi:arylsulfatase A-like enzyme
MSGRYGIRNGVVSNHGAGARFQIETNAYGGPLYANEMFPRVLKRHGYDPICFSNFADRHFAMWFMCGWSEFHTINLKSGGESAEEVNEKVLPWLRRNAARENYYLHINYWDTHRTYDIAPTWAEKFRDYPVSSAWPDAKTIQSHQAFPGPFTAHGQFKGDLSTVALMPGAIHNRADYEMLVTAYDASIAYVDQHIEQVLDALDRQGVLEDAVIIISGDHGDAFGEHGIYSDHVNVDECIHRIPLIIRWPGITLPNSTSQAFMYNVDYAPTICDTLGMPIPEDWDGKSYRANLEGQAGEDRDFLVWDSGLYTVQRAVRTRPHLYIRTYDRWEYQNWADEELYDINQDPFQTRNLAAEFPDVVNNCQKMIEVWVSEQIRKRNWHSDPLLEVLKERGVQPHTSGRLP